MPPIHDSAIVLKRLDYSESSQVLVLMTRAHGKVRVIAKGARRSTKARFNPGIDLLDAGDVVFSAHHIGQEALAPVTEWKQVRAFTSLRDRLDRLNAAQFAADVAAALTEDWDPHPHVYHAVLDVLARLCDEADVIAPLATFLRTLLDDVGLMPRFDACVGCSRPHDAAIELYFTSTEGGVLCRDCEPARAEKRLVRIDRGALGRFEFVAPGDIAGAFDILAYHVTHLMGRPPAAHAQLADVARRFGAGARAAK